MGEVVAKKVVKKAAPKKVAKKVVAKKVAAKPGQSKSISGIFDSILLGQSIEGVGVSNGRKGKVGGNVLSKKNWLLQAVDSLGKLPEGRTTRMTRKGSSAI